MAIMRKSFSMQVDGPSRKRAGPNRRTKHGLSIDLNKCNLCKDLAHDNKNSETKFMQLTLP